ncbi:MAG: four helix bundle suffix domain-containing protein [Tidjanibacter sp.]|nr:four helix bundle suffix domain-containing protein [Tidjanibacter sp.]
MAERQFVGQKGNYRNLIVFQKAECIYDVTFYFAHHFFGIGDRNIDQMIQAARSGKQNIAEGSSASTTSKEAELKLLNVAKSSLQELLNDYEDYLRVRGLEQWEVGSEKFEQARTICRNNSDSAFYRQAVETRSAETIANIAIIMINQTDYLLKHLFDKLKDTFLKNGGIREEMSHSRAEYRKTHSTK